MNDATATLLERIGRIVAELERLRADVLCLDADEKGLSIADTLAGESADDFAAHNLIDCSVGVDSGFNYPADTLEEMGSPRKLRQENRAAAG